jgi:PAS domain S-box-containing protein
MPKNESEKQKELYLRILNQFPNPIWRAGSDAKCDFFNKNWLEFTGRTIDQEMGDGWVEGVHPDDLDSCIKTYQSAFDAKKPFDMEYRLKHNDGTYHWLVDYGSPFFDENDDFLGYIGSCYDINDEKNHLEEMKKLNALMTDRELKMVELKKEIENLKNKD